MAKSGSDGYSAEPIDAPLSRPFASPEDEAKRRRVLKLWYEMDSEYRTWEPTHRDIVDFLQPNHGHFDQFMDSNKGYRRDGKVVNNVGADASRKLSAVIDTAATSEAREWITISPENPLDAEVAGHREYCHEVQAILFAYIARSGFYPVNRNYIDDKIGPGTALMWAQDDGHGGAYCQHSPIGSYRVAPDYRGETNIVIERFIVTAAQCAEEFGVENCSPAVQIALKTETTQITKVQILHCVERRQQRQHGKIDAKNKPWSSIWLEIGTGFWGANILGTGEISDPLGPAGLLRESGYDEKPFACSHWNTIGRNSYGNDSPGWNALGDAKALQDLEVGGATAMALIIRPPMNRPDSLKNASLLPGAINAIASDARSKFEPSMVVPPESITVLQNLKREHEARISRAFFGDLLFMFSHDQSAEKDTAEAVRAKKEERLLQLGGAFSRYSVALHDMVSRFFAMAQRAGLMPKPPPALLKSGKLKIDFNNPLVTAQKAITFTGMSQLVSFALAASQAKAAGVDKIDFDELIDTAADMLGVKPNVLLSDDQLAKQRAAAAAQQQQQQQAQSLPQAAGAINDLSNSDPQKLQALLSQFGPNAQVQGAGQP